MNSKEVDFLASALTADNPRMRSKDFTPWLRDRRQAHRFEVKQIPFEELQGWTFEHSTGNLIHASGKFFSIEGVRVSTDFGPVRQWSQPIIVQPEVGILGILARKFDGVLHFLMQAKMEPGNVDLVQLGPTVQATRSNFTRVHRGKLPPYLDRFLDLGQSRALVDVLQSEQGARFLRKRNRNMIVQTTADVPVLDDYCWLTLGQIGQLARRDNLVNMDARTVLSCIPLAAPELRSVAAGDDLRSEVARLLPPGPDIWQGGLERFAADRLASLAGPERSEHSLDEILQWLTQLKCRYELEVERIPLKSVQGWRRTDMQIEHDDDKYFAVIAVAVAAGNREVPAWTQPLVKPCQEGIVAYLVKEIDGVLHFLVQAKVEPGNFDVVEIAPTVQCITGSYQRVEPGERPPFVEYVLNAHPSQVRYSALQSEEGGRFFREQNRNMVVEVDEGFADEVPDNYLWVTERQLRQLVKFNNYVNVEGRCLLACLGYL
jgi:dTDP-4-dehydro-6-deoxy-alpha-D-glucopyranose 2,3-dehydratase